VNIRRGQVRNVLLVLMYLIVPREGSAAEESERVEMAAQPRMTKQMSPEQARGELQRLVDEAIFVASQQLNDMGTFYPYAAVMEANGEIKLVGVPAEQEGKPQPQQTVKALKKALLQLDKKKKYRAVAIFVDFVAKRKDTGGRQSGIRIELEHRLPDTLSVFQPYLVSNDGTIRLLTPQYMPGSLSVLN